MCNTKAEGGPCASHAWKKLMKASASKDSKRIATARLEFERTSGGIRQLRAIGDNFKADLRQAERDEITAGAIRALGDTDKESQTRAVAIAAWGRGKYDKDGYDWDRYDKNGFNKEGYNRGGKDKNGFNGKGLDVDGFYPDGFDLRNFNREGINKKSGTKFNKNGYDRDGYDDFGFNEDGLDKNGSLMSAKDQPLAEQETKLPEKWDNLVYIYKSLDL